MEYGQPRPLIRQPHINQSLRGVARMIRVLCDALEIGMQRVAEHGEHNCRFALKKRAAQLLLQPDNGVGQRRLGDAASSGCPREVDRCRALAGRISRNLRNKKLFGNNLSLLAELQVSIERAASVLDRIAALNHDQKGTLRKMNGLGRAQRRSNRDPAQKVQLGN